MSRILKSVVFVAIISSVAISPAWADPYGHHGSRHGHHGGGHRHNAFGWGLGILAGTAVIVAAASQPRVYYPSVAAAPVYLPQPVIAPPIIVAPPPVYAQQQDYWYYCAQAGGYYPYVASCPAGWMKVVPN